MAFLVGGANTLSADDYEIDNSLRFNDDDSSYLRRTFSGGSRTTFTVSFWIKRGNILTSDMNLFDGYSDDNNRLFIYFTNDDLRIFGKTAATTYVDVVTDRKFRDPSAWYHFVVAFDTTQGTEGNRIKVYVNGVQETSFSTYDVLEDYATFFNDNTRVHTVGTREDSGGEEGFYDGYMSEVHYIDGTQYAASNFGKTNDNGVWIPKKPSVTYGTNGYYLQFKQTGTGTASSSTIGADTSGEDNHLTSTNLASTDVTTDTPTNNFCTLNPLVNSSQATYSEGNCDEACNDNFGVSGSMAVANGKWYWEVKIKAGDNNLVGIVNGDELWRATVTFGFVNYSVSVYCVNGKIYKEGSEVEDVSDTIGANDIIGVRLDLDSGTRTVSFYKNNSAFGSAVELPSWDIASPMVRKGGSSQTTSFNFGNPSFSISSGNADDNGYGNFEYDVPTGYYALCTKNLAEFG